MAQTKHNAVSHSRDDESTKPVHSLPSYNEPTPETHRKITREEEAELALNNTRVSHTTRVLLIAAFLFTVVSIPLVQTLAELRSNKPLTIVAPLKLLHGYSWPRAEEIKSLERQIERDSVVALWLLPHAQLFLTQYLGAGNEQVYVGKNGWLFYRPDVDYVTGPPFLDPAQMRRRRTKNDVEPDSIRAITNFREQLAARGIELIVMPAPVKPTIDSKMLGTAASGDHELQNQSYEPWKQKLQDAGVKVFDCSSMLRAEEKATSRAQYLATDSHWRPEAMELVAKELAELIGQQPSTTFNRTDKQVSTRGDIAQMLKLPTSQKLVHPETATIHPVLRGDSLWRSDKNAPLLLLGDSFTNIYSLEAMQWGEAAGFAEQLSYSLGTSIDVIARNSDGAFATREMLQRELAHGRDRLSGKKVVVWEFAARELASGDWKLLNMQLGQAGSAKFFTPQPSAPVVVDAVIEDTSLVPRPGTVPYKDHIMSLHLVDVTGLTTSNLREVLAYTWSMRDNAWTTAARLRPGDHVRLRLRAWSEVAPALEKFNRSEIDDAAVQMEEPAWGDLLPQS